MKSIIKISMLIIIVIFSTNVFAEYEFVEWKTPIQRFSDFGFDPEFLGSFIGDGQLLVTTNPKTIKLWNKKDNFEKEYKNVRIAYAMCVIDAPIDKLREIAFHVSGSEYMPAIENVKDIERKKNDVILQFNQVYRLGPVKLKSKFVYQVGKLPNGDVTALLHNGDVGAMVNHYEFYPLKNKKILTIMGSWQDVDTARFTYRMLLNAEPALKEVVAALSPTVHIEQVKSAATEIDFDSKKMIDPNKLGDEAPLPLISERKDIPVDSLLKLTSIGSVQIFHPRVFFNHMGEPSDLLLATGIKHINAPVDKVRPLFTDFSNGREYHPFFKEYKSPAQTGEAYAIVEACFHVLKFEINLDNHIYEAWPNKNVKTFKTNGEAAVGSLRGAFEMIEVPKNDSTIVAFTFGGKCGEKAPFFYKLISSVSLFERIQASAFSFQTTELSTKWIQENWV